MPLFGQPNIEQLKEKKDTKGLIKVLESQIDAGIRKDAAIALGEIGEGSAFEALVSALDDEDKGVRASAARGLGILGDYRGVQPILRRLEQPDEFSSSFDEALLDIFSTIKDADTQQKMMEQMLGVLNDKEGRLKIAAAKFVGHVAENKVGDPSYIVRTEEALLNALSQEDQYLQATALTSLALCLQKDDIDHLYVPIAEKLSQQRILRQAPLRLSALKMLSVSLNKIDDPGLQGALRAAFRGHTGDNRSEVRLLCYQSLGKIGEDSDVRALHLSLIKDVNRACQQAAAEAVNNINPILAKELLLQQIDAFDIAQEQSNMYKTNWYGAIEVLCDLGQDWVVEPLEAILMKKDFEGIAGRDTAGAVEAIKQKG